MGWSAEYRLPEARIEPERLRALIEERLPTLPHAALAYFGAGPTDDHLAAGISFVGKSGRSYQGCIEWWFEQPARELEVRVTKASEIYDRLHDARDDDEEQDEQDEQDEQGDEPPWEAHEWLPRRFSAFAGATSTVASILGNGRGRLEVGRSWARIELVVPQSVLSDDAFRHEEAALAAIARDGDVEWACGYPGLLLRRGRRDEAWTHVPLALPEGVSITNVLPRGPDERWLITDVGGVWRMRGDTLARIEGVPDSDDYPGGTDPIWSIASRGEEVWIANGSKEVFCLSGGVVRRVALPGNDAEVQRLVVEPEGRLWLATRDQLWTGDGARFERVLDDDRIEVLRARPRGVVIVSSAGRLTTVAGGAVEVSPIEEAKHIRTGVLASDDDAVLWLLAGSPRPNVLHVDLPTRPATRMTVRSNRDDNREDECWYAITALASEICTALGGVDVQ